MEAAAITSRRNAYAYCLAQLTTQRRKALSVKDEKKIAEITKRQHITLWALGILMAYTLPGETCEAQYCPTEDDVRCAIRLADPGCVKCKCEAPLPNPTPPPPPCNIEWGISVRFAWDAALFDPFLTSRVYVISDVNPIPGNPWGQHVGSVFQGTTRLTVPVGTIVYAQIGASFWVQTPDGPGAYFPLLDGAMAGPTTVQITSQWPSTNAYLSTRTIKVEVLENGVWREVYNGIDNQGTPQNYAADAPTSVRVTYTNGPCSYGPYVTQIGSPGDHNREDHNDDHY